MGDLDDIPTYTLIHDLIETIEDIKVCQLALALGLLEYGNGHSVQERLEGNREIKKVIEEELRKRGHNG